MKTEAGNRLGTEKIGKLMLELALPSVLAQIVNVLYNIVDRIYIGRIPGVGAAALTGVGVTFPIITIISAFAGFTNGGGAPLAAIALGQGNKKRAEKILGNSTSLLLFFSVILMALFLIFKCPLLYLFGASAHTISYSSAYITVYLIGTVFVELAVGLNTFISCQGHARTAMMSVLIGAIANIVLDPILIFVFHLGVVGAAVATVISQALSAAWVVRFLVSEQSEIRLKFTELKPDRSILASILALGISPFIMSATESAITIVMNHGLQVYGGDLYVGSMTILQSVLQLVFVPIGGFTSGIQPIISYNFGAGQFDRVKKTIRLMLTVTLSASLIYVVFTMLYPGVFAGMFTNDAELIKIVKKVLPVYMAGMTVFGAQSGVQSSSWTGTGKNLTVYRTAEKSGPVNSVGTDFPAFLGCYGSILCRTGCRYYLGCDGGHLICYQYSKNFICGDAGKGDTRGERTGMI